MGHFGKKPVRLAWFAARLARPAAELLRPGRAAARQPRRRSRIRSSRSRRARCCRSSCCSRRPRRSSRRRRPSRARSRSRVRPCSSTCCRACTILQTSADERGQIYVPAVNGLMFVAVIGLRAGVPVVGRAVGSLRRRRDRHDGDHDAPRRGRRAHRVAVARVADRRGRSACSCSSTSRSSPATRPRSRAAAGCRCCSRRIMFMGFDHLARRPRAAAASAAAPRGAVDRAAEAARGRDEGAGHGGVPREPQRLRADGAAAQPRAQPRLPRAHRDPESRDPAQRRARIARRARGSRSSCRTCTPCARASASWRRRT